MDNPSDGSMLGGQPAGNENGGATFNGPEWMANLPQELKESKSLSKFSDVENLARGYVNAEKLIGRDKLIMPKTDDEFAEIYAKLGCPDDVSGYKLAVDDSKIGEQFKGLVQQDLESFLPMAKEAGLNNKQAQLIFNKYLDASMQMRMAQQAKADNELAEAEAALRKEFGETTDTKLALANRMLSQLGGENVIKAITDSGLGRNTEFIKMMVKLGEAHAEELGIDKTGNSGAMTPAAIRDEIAQLQANPAYLDASHPEHRLIVERVQSLFARMS